MSNKNDALWMSNCNAVKKYLFLNKKMPLKDKILWRLKKLTSLETLLS